MATHSSILAWRNPGTGEPFGLPSMGLHSRTRLNRLSSSSSCIQSLFSFSLVSLALYYFLKKLVYCVRILDFNVLKRHWHLLEQ